MTRRIIQLYRGTAAQNDAFTGAAGELTMDTTNNELRVHDGSTQGGHKIGTSNYHPDLFDRKWSDHIVNDIQWLRADTFSWHNGGAYEAAYNHLVDDIDGKNLQSETVGGTTVQFYLADDGHKICPASEASNVAAIYTATGVAWYYIIDTVNEVFKLPRAKHNKYAATLSVVGNGAIGFHSNQYTGAAGLQLASSGYNAQFSNIATSLNRSVNVELHNDPTKSGVIAQQEEDIDQYKYLYFYVGNFTQTALENTAGLNAELFNVKVDIGHEVVAFQAPTSANNYTWYRKYRDGWVEQGGIIASTSSDTTSITFLIPFSDTSYTIVTNVADATTTAIYTISINNKSTTGCDLYRGGNVRNFSTMWRAEGMAAS